MKIDCEWCGKTFERKIRWVKINKKKGRRNVCGQKCLRQLARASGGRGVGPTKVLVQCAACGKPIEKNLSNYNAAVKRGRELVCDRKCSGRYSQGIRYTGKRMKPRIIDNLKVEKSENYM